MWGDEALVLAQRKSSSPSRRESFIYEWELREQGSQAHSRAPTLTSFNPVQRRGTVCDWRNVEGRATVIYVVYGHMIIVAWKVCNSTIEMWEWSQIRPGSLQPELPRMALLSNLVSTTAAVLIVSPVSALFVWLDVICDMFFVCCLSNRLSSFLQPFTS